MTGPLTFLSPSSELYLTNEDENGLRRREGDRVAEDVARGSYQSVSRVTVSSAWATTYSSRQSGGQHICRCSRYKETIMGKGGFLDRERVCEKEWWFGDKNGRENTGLKKIEPTRKIWPLH
jgi:hypothetical protein